MMLNRSPIRDIAKKSRIPNATIAVVSGMASSNISVFMNGGILSRGMEERIATSTKDIAKLLERFGSVRPDLSDAPRIKELVQSMKEQTVFSVLLETEPATAFFVSQAHGQIITTPFFLRALPLHLDVARAIAEDLHERYSKAVVVENCYGGPDALAEIEDVDTPRGSVEYRSAMGLTEQALNS